MKPYQYHYRFQERKIFGRSIINYREKGQILKNEAKSKSANREKCNIATTILGETRILCISLELFHFSGSQYYFHRAIEKSPILLTSYSEKIEYYSTKTISLFWFSILFPSSNREKPMQYRYHYFGRN